MGVINVFSIGNCIPNIPFGFQHHCDRPGGGVLSFFFIRRLGPSIYRSPPKNYQEFQAPKNFFGNFSDPKRYPPF